MFSFFFVGFSLFYCLFCLCTSAKIKIWFLMRSGWALAKYSFKTTWIGTISLSVREPLCCNSLSISPPPLARSLAGACILSPGNYVSSISWPTASGLAVRPLNACCLRVLSGGHARARIAKGVIKKSQPKQNPKDSNQKSWPNVAS